MRKKAQTPTSQLDIPTSLHDQAKLGELIADNTPAFIAYVDAKERYRFTNKVFQEWVGYSKQEAYGKTVRELRGKKAYKALKPYLREALAGKSTSYDHIFEKKDGSTIFVNSKYIPNIGSHGKVEGVYVLLLDITDRKKVEERMKESDERLQRLIAGNVIGVVISGLEGAIYEANDIYLKMVGYTREDLHSGKVNWLKMTPPEYHKVNQKAEKQIMTKGASTPYEKEYIRKDGSRVAVLVGDVLLDKPTRKLIAFVLDISKQKELERRKDEFIAMASHELKTPLTSLKMYAQLVEHSFQRIKDERAGRLLGSMDRQIDKLTELVNDLLDVSRIQSGKLQYKKELFTFDKLIKESVEDLQRVSKHKLFIKGKTGRVVRADRDRIKQVLTNLITNATKYSPKADKIIMSLKTKENEIQVGVQDFGIGVPVDQQQKIFDRFFQVQRPLSHTYPGLGLGLYITKEIVERHQGRIWVVSKKGKGSTFYFTLPLSDKAGKQK